LDLCFVSLLTRRETLGNSVGINAVIAQAFVFDLE